MSDLEEVKRLLNRAKDEYQDAAEPLILEALSLLENVELCMKQLYDANNRQAETIRSIRLIVTEPNATVVMDPPAPKGKDPFIGCALSDAMGSTEDRLLAVRDRAEKTIQDRYNIPPDAFVSSDAMGGDVSTTILCPQCKQPVNRTYDHVEGGVGAGATGHYACPEPAEEGEKEFGNAAPPFEEDYTLWEDPPAEEPENPCDKCPPICPYDEPCGEKEKHMAREEGEDIAEEPETLETPGPKPEHHRFKKGSEESLRALMMPAEEPELTPEEFAQAQEDILKAELEKCSGCGYYAPSDPPGERGYCAYSSEGHCGYTPAEEPEKEGE